MSVKVARPGMNAPPRRVDDRRTWSTQSANGGSLRRWEMDGIGRENLTLREVPQPEPPPGQVLVEVAAVSLNYRDKMVIETGR